MPRLIRKLIAWYIHKYDSGSFYTQEQLNAAIKKTIEAVRSCGENSDCNDCYLYIRDDDCIMNLTLDDD